MRFYYDRKIKVQQAQYIFLYIMRYVFDKNILTFSRMLEYCN